ncbi:MAG: GNAT family N-acetyltransferase [Methanobacteriota archaeon]
MSEPDIQEFSGDVERLYRLWKAAASERPWETLKTPDQFNAKYLDDPFQQKGFVLAVVSGGNADGAALTSLVPELERAIVRLWVAPERQRKGLGTSLLKETVARLRKRGRWRLECEPVPFCPGYNAFFKANGFEPDADFPGGYLMRHGAEFVTLAAEPKGCRTARVRRIQESEYFDRVADVAIDDSGGRKIDLAERKNEMLAAMADARAQCYSLALDGERVLGFSRSAIVENVAGELQLRNRGLIVSTEARGKGIGRALLDDNLAWGFGEGARVAYISTHSKNPAKRLYERAGYRVVETMENLVLQVG